MWPYITSCHTTNVPQFLLHPAIFSILTEPIYPAAYSILWHPCQPTLIFLELFSVIIKALMHIITQTHVYTPNVHALSYIHIYSWEKHNGKTAGLSKLESSGTDMLKQAERATNVGIGYIMM